MTRLFTIFRRELGAYFGSPIAAIFLIVFTLFANGLFMLQFFQSGKADMRPFFSSLPFLLNIFIPAIAMRLWAEDKKGNTFELLMTFPLRPGELVLGKFLAGLIFYLAALATSFVIPVMISWAGPMDMGMIAGGYIGAMLMGAFFLAVGIFISGLCKDQIVAFILTVVAVFAAFFLGMDAFVSIVDGWLPGIGTFFKNSFSISSHLSSFGKGVIDLRDVLYFVLGSGIFLFLNGLSLEGRYRPRAKLIFSGAVAVCLSSLILAGWLMRDLPLPRFDLTEGKFNTISPATSKILGSLKVPVKVKLYISPVEHMPTAMKTLEREITDRLEELKIVSDGKFDYRTVHLDTSEQSEELKNKLKNDGVTPFQVESVQKDEVGVKLVYSTLVIEYKEKAQEILPRLVPQSLGDIEYQLLSRIFKMTMEEKPRVAVYAPIGAQALPADHEDNFKTAVTLMRNNGYDVSRIAFTKDDPLPERSRALMMFAPGALSERQRWEINRYLRQGGTVLLAAQGYEFTYHQEESGMQAIPEKKSLDVNRLLEKWGVKIGEDMLMDEHSQVVSLTSGQRIGPFALQIPVKFPNQIVVTEDNINRSAPITQRVPALMYLWGSALELTEATLASTGLKSTVLFTSSAKSWTKPYNSEPLTAANTESPKDLKGKYPLAALLEGTFTDAFGGQAPAWVAGEAAEAISMGEAKPGRLMIVGCSKAFSEDLLQNGGNLNLFANAVDGLVLGEDLIQIRSKAAVVRDLRTMSSGEKLWFRFFSIFLVPLFLLAGALIRHFIRKKEKEFYLAAIRSSRQESR